MFTQLLKCPRALARHRDGPLGESRRRYLIHWAEQGMAVPTLSVLACYLRTVTRYLRLDERADEPITESEIEAVASRWANRRPHPKTGKRRFARRRFIRVAKRWLRFLGRLQLPAPPRHLHADRVAAFTDFQKEKGLSQQTVIPRRRVVQRFLDRLCSGGRRLEKVTAVQVDESLSAIARESGLGRVSLRTYAGYLRVFLRFAEKRGWCREGLSRGIMFPRVYARETIPVGPSWNDMRRLLATTEGDRPADIRARALLMLFVVYGFRSGEVRALRLDDLDWERELINVRRVKHGKTQLFPLSRIVGDAILRYLREVRPPCRHREIFLTLCAPIQPLRDCAMREVVASRLRALGLSLPHYGPHALRHACATHLLDKGHSLKEIGDYLGHVCPDSTRLYAKVNLSGLRAVADFDLEGLI